jgi:hypothetical protein
MDSYLRSLLGEGEELVFVTRRHWFVLAAEIISEVVLSLALIVLITLTAVLFPLSMPWIFLGLPLLILPLISLSRDAAVWANRKFVVTNRRVIQLEGVFSKDITDSSLEKVNDVKMEQSFLGRLLDYGDIEILTASELGANKFTRIASPIRFKTAMLNAKNRLEERLAGVPAPRAVPAAPPPPPAAAHRAGLLEHVQSQRDEPAPTQPNPPASVPAAPAAGDIPALIRQLDELRQRGVLTEAEFQNKKAQLLSRL